jgi:hypothetical protein
METELITHNCTEFNSDSSNPFFNFTFDMPKLIEKMKLSHTWINGELKTMILLRNPDKQILLTAIHEGTEIDSFQSKDSITIEIIEGELEFYSGKGNIVLYNGQCLTLRDNIEYNLTAKEETFFLLTIVSGTRNRERNHDPDILNN